MRRVLASALHLFVVLAFSLIGLFFVLLPHLPSTREKVIDLLSNRYEECTQIGMGFLLATFVFFFGFYAINRGKVLVIRMGVSTDLKAIRHTVENCFAKQFPKKISLKEVEIGPKSSLDFTVQLAPLDEAMREELFVQVEQQVGILLRERFGYSKSFHLIVNAP